MKTLKLLIHWIDDNIRMSCGRKDAACQYLEVYSTAYWWWEPNRVLQVVDRCSERSRFPHTYAAGPHQSVSETTQLGLQCETVSFPHIDEILSLCEIGKWWARRKTLTFSSFGANGWGKNYLEISGNENCIAHVRTIVMELQSWWKLKLQSAALSAATQGGVCCNYTQFPGWK